MIEQLHDSGKLPDRYYYQLNKKTATANYKSQKEKDEEDSKAYRTLRVLFAEMLYKELDKILKAFK